MSLPHWQDQLGPPPQRCDFSDKLAPRFCADLAPMVDDPRRKGFGWRSNWIEVNFQGVMKPSGKGYPGSGPFAGLFYVGEWGKPGKQVRACPFCEAKITPPHPRPEPPAS